MRKSMLGIRSYQLNMILATLIFALALAITSNSLGTANDARSKGNDFNHMDLPHQPLNNPFDSTGSILPYLTASDTQDQHSREEVERMLEELRPVTLPEGFPQSIAIQAQLDGARLSAMISLEPAQSSPPADSVHMQRLQSAPAGSAEHIVQSPLEQPTLPLMPDPRTQIEQFELNSTHADL